IPVGVVPQAYIDVGFPADPAATDDRPLLQKCPMNSSSQQDRRIDAVTSRSRPPAADADARTREIRRLSTLLEVSQALSGTLNVKGSLHRVLEILARHHGVVRGIVSLVDADGDLRVEASDGLGDGSRPVRYGIGEGITGQVVQSAKPIVVPRGSRGPALLRRPARRPQPAHHELTLTCV